MNRIVLVEWEDHLFDVNTYTIEDFVPEIQIRRNVGFVVKETDDLISFCDGFWVDSNTKHIRIENIFTLSKSMVKSIKEIGESE